MDDEQREGRPIRTGRAARTAKLGGLVAGQGLRWAGTRAANAVRGERRASEASERRAVAMAEELVARLGEMKGAAMKLGQVLSMIEPVGLPEEERERVKRKLGELRDRVEPVPFRDVRRVLEQDLGSPLREAFAEFEERPFAAASIGQVHRATTLEGASVAVKVQYPGVAEAVEADLRNLNLLFPLIRRLAPGLDVRAVAGELRERIGEELDYELEAQNQRTLERAWRGHPYVRIPRVDTALSTRRVLVTELVEGLAFDDVRGLPEAERDRFGEILFRFFFATLGQLSTSLGDPHPGNYLLCPDRRVCFLDFGFVRRVPQEHLDGERALAQAIVDEDAPAVAREMENLGYLPPGERFEAEGLLEQLRFAAGWMFDPGFRRLSPDFVREAIERGGSPRSPWYDQMRRQTLPPASLLMRRMEGLLLSVLGELRAGADWAAICAEYVRDAPPSTELGEADRDFWQARPAAR